MPPVKGLVIAVIFAALVASGVLMVPILEHYAWSGILLTGTILYGVFFVGLINANPLTMVLVISFAVIPVVGVADQAIVGMLALRTQQVIAYESGVTGMVDPLGGSYFLERLTLDMERGAREYFETIDRLGGMVAAIEDGFPQREIAEASYRFQQAVESREQVIVGVNGFIQEDEPPTPILYIDESTADTQLARLTELRRHARHRRGAPFPRGAPGRRPRHQQHDVPPARVRPRLRHRRRDVRRAAGGVGGVSRGAVDLGRRFYGCSRFRVLRCSFHESEGLPVHRFVAAKVNLRTGPVAQAP